MSNLELQTKPDGGASVSTAGFGVSAAELRDGEPCDHPGCLSHVSHPCEGCGRVGGFACFRNGTPRWAVCYCGMQMVVGETCGVCGYECKTPNSFSGADLRPNLAADHAKSPGDAGRT